MITLYQTPSVWGVPNLSPFCIKLETWLRMVALPYQVKPADLRKAPKGKVPYVDIDGKLMGDSQLIIEHLQRKHGIELDAKLSAEQVALGHAVRRMLEESTYWHIVYVRWVDEAGWQAYKPVFLAMMPPLVGGLILEVLRKQMFKTLHAQGLGRHRPEEVLELGKADVSSLAALLGDKPFLLGEEPSSFDATVYAFVVGLTSFPVDSPLKRHTLAQENLVRFCERFKERYFADWKPATAQAA